MWHVLARLGQRIARAAGAAALLWLVLAGLGYAVAVGGLFTGESLFSRLSSGEPGIPGEARDGLELLARASPTGPSFQLILSPVDPTSPETLQALGELHQELTDVPGVAAVADPTVAGPALISTAGDAVLVDVALERGLPRDAEAAAGEQVVDLLTEAPSRLSGSAAAVGGVPLLVDEITSQVEEDLRTGEGVALPVSLLIMVLIFGGFAAAGVPILGALASVAGGLAALHGFSYLVDLDATVVNVVTVLGLGLSIDYSLLVVSRYREELRVGERSWVPSRDERAAAMGRTLATAGRTVLFSGVTVAICVSAMLFFRIDIVQAIGIGAACVVLVALLVALTLVPALLVLMTRWVAGPGALTRLPVIGAIARHMGGPPTEEGAFSRLARWVQARPLWVFLGATAVLVALALPVLRLQIVDSGVELLPPGNPQREFFLRVQDEFPAGAAAPVRVVTTDPAVAEQVAASVGDNPAVTRVEVREVGDVAVAEVFTSTPGQSPETQDLVRELRAADTGDQTLVTGQAAQLVDFTDELQSRAPLALAVVVVTTGALLFLLTGSVLIPVKALIMNLLSLGAAFGILVLVFQDGRGETLLGFSSTGGIEWTIPVLVVAFAFGLSMDYEMFLLARIKEIRDTLGVDNDTAVRMGLQRTGRIITSAALLIVVVFSGFVVGRLLVIKETGVALAVAVFIDATIVRILLVPATMTLLGEWNWWAPKPLRRLHERLGLTDA
jgi:RND superfamily putative drug exporter